MRSGLRQRLGGGAGSGELFTIESDGSTSDIEWIQRSGDLAFDLEALPSRFADTLPRGWIAGLLFLVGGFLLIAWLGRIGQPLMQLYIMTYLVMLVR